MDNLKTFLMFCYLTFVLLFHSNPIEATAPSTFHIPQASSNNRGCVSTFEDVNHQTAEHWQLVYEDNFKQNSSLADWIIGHETKHSNGGHFRSCVIEDNVRVIDGHLVLQAGRTPHYSHQFTGAKIWHRVLLNYGRYEVRVAHPVGAAIFSDVKVSDEYRSAHIDLSAYSQDYTIENGMWLRNGTSIPMLTLWKHFFPSDLVFSNFNVYGVELNASVARLYINNFYSPPFQIGNYTYKLGNYHSLILQLMILGQETQGRTDLLWTCPAMIVDYVRIFQRINSIKPTQSYCTFRPPTPDSVIDPICSQVMESITDKEFAKDSRKGSPQEPHKETPVIMTNSNEMLIVWLCILSCLIIILIIICLVLLFKKSSTGTANNSIQWRWTTNGEHQESHQLNEGFARSSENVF